jgi:hypothetical protein
VLGPEEAAAFGAPGPQTRSAPTPPGPLPTCRIQIASYRDAGHAAETLERLRLSGISAVIEVAGSYRRIVLPAVPAPEVDQLVSRLASLGYRGLLLIWTP